MAQAIVLNDGWEFSKEFRMELCDKGYKGNDLEKVRLPHSNCNMPFHHFDESIYQMVCGYRKEIKVDQAWEGKHVLLTFEGIAHCSQVYINGKKAGEHNCGYTAFTMDISSYLIYGDINVIAVRVDSRETNNVPPFGRVIDYMTYGGIYREAYLELKEECYFEDIFVQAKNVLNSEKELVAQVKLNSKPKHAMIRMMLQKNGEKETVLLESAQIDSLFLELTSKISKVDLWDLENPVLYQVQFELWSDEKLLDEKEVQFGFREAVFKTDGFYLNGKKTKIIGLNRHQSFPYVGYAMPKAPQIRDAEILKRELGVNAVRTSHYPQSHHFIKRCDELGLLVFTEIPGWQHIGDEEWKDVACKNVEEMIIQYRNHPSIVLWGVRINESPDDDEFYKRTNEIAHRLDSSRQTGGVRCIKDSHLFEDVYTYNDFVHTGKNIAVEDKKKVTSKISAPYLISEFNGHMYPTKSFDCEEHRLEHALRHARVLDTVMGKEDIAGAFGWCMFDYNTHKDFGSGDRICYHGVMDMFRNPKQAAAIYGSQSEKEPFLEISSSMDIGEHPGSCLGAIYAYTNLDSVRLYKNNEFISEFKRKNGSFNNLKHSPILIDDFVGNQLVSKEGYSQKKSDLVKDILNAAACLGMDKLPLSVKLKALKAIVVYRMSFHDAVRLFNDYVGNWGKEVVSYRFEGIKDGKIEKTIYKNPMTKVTLQVDVDHTELVEEETYDVASIRIKACDQSGNVLPYFQEPVELKTDGDIELVGPELIGLKGGMGGTFVKTVAKKGTGNLTITSPGLDIVNIEFNIR